MSRRIRQDDYERIKALVADKGKPEVDRRRDELKGLSDDRVARWPNTLQALRRQKETAFLERKAKREKELQKIDQEEDRKKSNARKEKIEYASRTIFHNTEKMKRLQTAEILVDCIEGRGKQIDLKKRIQASEKTWEKQFLEMDRERYDRLAKREEEELSRRAKAAKEIAQVQSEQLAEVKKKKREELEELMKEGKQIAVKAERELQEDREIYMQTIRKAQRNCAEITEANDRMKSLRAEQEAKDAEQDRKIEEYAAYKLDLDRRRKKQSAYIEKLKQQKRQEMIDEGVRRLAAMNTNDERRLEAQAREARDAEDERNRVRDEKRAAFGESIRLSRERQTKRKNQEREERLAREQAFSNRWKLQNATNEERERDENKMELLAAKEHQEYLRVQMHEKNLRDLHEKGLGFEAMQDLANNVQNEEDEFERIAYAKIDKLQKEGKDPYPLLKCIAQVKQENLLAAV